MKALIAILTSTALTSGVALAQAQPPAQQPGAAQQQAGQNRPMPASDIRGKEVANARGEAVGRVERVMIGQGDQAYAVIRFNENVGVGVEPRLVPASRMSMRENRLVLAGEAAEIRQMDQYRAGMAGYRDAEANQQVALGGAPNQQADASRIVVQQPAPTIRVDQAPP